MVRNGQESRSNGSEAGAGGTLFRWETLRVIGPYPLNFRPPVPGTALEVELVGGRVIQVWRGDDGQGYFCHGLTFGGKQAPGGPISPFTGQPVMTILSEHYRLLDPESLARPGDIVVWKAPAELASTPHSAIITRPRVIPGKSYLDYTTELLTKNGLAPEMVMSFRDLADEYGETYNVYTRE